MVLTNALFPPPLSQGLQLFAPDAKLSYSTILAGHPFLASPPAQLALDSQVCENHPLPFPTAAPTSTPNMALVAETERIVAQFDYTNEDVNKGVKEFLRQMGKS